MRLIRQKPRRLAQLRGSAATLPSLDEVSKFAHDSSTKNRNFYIAYLALSFYVLVMALSITDKELLLDERQLPIPLLALGLKPIIWFLVAPSALFVMYLDVILNLREHLRKLIAWRDTCGGELPTEQVQPFIVDFAFANRQRGFWGKLYHFMLWLSIAMLAPSTLLVCLVQFGAYQNLLSSSYHLLLAILSLALASYFMCVWKQAVSTQKNDRVALLHWKGKLRFMLTTATTWFATLLTALALGYGWVIERFSTGQWLPEQADFVLAPRLKVPNSVLISVDNVEKQALELLQSTNTAELATLIDNQGKKNEQLANLADLWWRHGAKLDFSHRKLNYANLSGSLLPRTLFINAQLKGADFIDTQLQGASFRKAELQGANLSGALLDNADLGGAQLQSANLGGAKLQFANLYQAQLQGANLVLALIQGANLDGAQMQGANLMGAILITTYLANAQLQGADLREAQLQGAKLGKTQFQGANLSGVNMYGAICQEILYSDNNVLKEADTDLSSCEKNHWRVSGKVHMASLDKELDKHIIQKDVLHKVMQKILDSNGKPIWLDALCGRLTKDMIDTFGIYKNQLGRIPDNIRETWTDTLKPCNAPAL